MSNQADCRNAVFYRVFPNLAGIIYQNVSTIISDKVFSNVSLGRFHVHKLIDIIKEPDRGMPDEF